MKRPFKIYDIPYVDSGMFTLYDFQGNKGKLITWNNQDGDTEHIKIIVSFNGIPVGYDQNGHNINIYDGEYFDTSLYIEDNTTNVRFSYDLEQKILKKYIEEIEN